MKESERRNSELLKKYEELEKQFQRKENVHLLEKCGMQVRKLLRCQKYYVIRETYIKLWKNNYVIYIKAEIIKLQRRFVPNDNN